MTKKKASALEIPAGTLYPVLPLRDIVVFPHMIVPLFVGRAKSIQALESVAKSNKPLLLLTQKNPSNEDPNEKDLYSVGTLGTILQLLKLPDGTVKVLAEGNHRTQVLRYDMSEPYLQAYAEIVNEEPLPVEQGEALLRTALAQFDQYVKLNTKVPPDVLASISKIEEPEKLVDTIAAHLNLKLQEKQALLEIDTLEKRLDHLIAIMEGEIGVLQTENRIRSRVKRQMEKTQREYYLNEQMKAIQKELGDSEDGKNEADEYDDRIKKTKLNKDAKEKAQAELRKLRLMNPMSSEATVIRNYLDWLLGIPWKKNTKLKHDLTRAKEILDDEHYGLERVKERIIEYLAVQKRMDRIQGPILCLVGPPGVGKTSLGTSIAHATGREFVRVALGGVRDEAEIRGHRRTYIGSMPGKIIQSMKKASSSNPLFLLDEIDKLGSDWRGDPSSAMLEVLDPAQNKAFADHYLEVDYDLSNVLFVTTANDMSSIPYALQDRLEIIRLSGYTEDEKVEIAKRHLIARQVKYAGLKEKEWSIDDSALRHLIRHYTRESGVRNLEREIANLTRKAVKEIIQHEETQVTPPKAKGKKTEKTVAAKKPKSKKPIKLTSKNIGEYAGVLKYRFGEMAENDLVGVTMGLAWTQVGGEMMVVEAIMMHGKGKMVITGKLGDVMQESIQAAASYIRARCVDFGVTPPFFEKHDIHIHVPEGATPKDGPSAGVAMCTSIVSVLSGIPVRRDVAMTGEITLQGRVLAIGGLKEKLLAAHRGGIKTVLIPDENVKDLEEIPQNVKEGLKIIPVKTVDEVLENALRRMPQPVKWDAEEKEAAAKSKGKGKEQPLTH
ncbi:endopeptidase La [Alphaproteobacteria bacterium]|nr:endopeptidase La [Alphaproteobacteria bacterium]